MNLQEQINRINELSGVNQNTKTVVSFHGTRTEFPFQKFDPSMIGTGIVSQGNKYNGFFFTSEFENAEFYTEYFIAKVKINGVKPNPLSTNHSPTVLEAAAKANEIYFIDQYHDGAIISDITVVPKALINNITILEWTFVGDEGWLFDKYDEFFGGEKEEETGEYYVNHGLIEQMLSMIQIDINYLLTIPIFKKYYDLRGN